MDRFDYDVIVIGGGLLGCFALRALTKYKLRAALLEQREDLCTGISRSNTAVVYSGCDTRPGTLKTELCVAAAKSFGKLCGELGVRYRNCGSLMVSFSDRGDKVLERKYSQGNENGVRDLRLLKPRQVLEMEPMLAENVSSGLYAPDAGTVNPWELCLAAAENAEANGGAIILNSKVTSIKKVKEGFSVLAGGVHYRAGAVINCAGLFSDSVYELLCKPLVRVIPTRGDYYVLDTKAGNYVNHVVFHEPEEKGKGLTLVPTTDGNILVGPTEMSAVSKTDFATDKAGLAELRRLVSEVMPSLPMEHVIRSFAALRPNPYYVNKDPKTGAYLPDGKGISSFTVLETPGFISLVGIKTPGMTCAAGLGELAAVKTADFLGIREENKDCNPVRPKPLRLAELSDEERISAAERDPAYGRIVCRCCRISEGEVIDAVKAGAVTADGVKRRAGTGMGRCQGGFCTEKVIEIIARELGIKPWEVTKDGTGSPILYGRMRSEDV